ncbi:MAG: homocysteine S-methyltransferase family protein [Microthrixaceae bacterium]
MTLPQLAGQPYLTDGGLETTLVFHDGFDLEHFAAFPLLDTDDGQVALRRYYGAYLDLARSLGTGFVLDTPTWRANPDWGALLGYDADRLADANRRAVRWIAELAGGWPDVDTVLNGVVGPRGDGYVVDTAMSPSEAADYHALQASAFASAGAAMMTAVTMTYSDEAAGVAQAGAAAGLPTVISFTVETDGHLPSGQSLREAIDLVDDATAGRVAYYMVNCAHPEHFAGVLGEGDWTARVRGIRPNASRLSHEELDAAEELDAGDPDDLAAQCRALAARLPALAVLGGCCGTDERHVGAIAQAVLAG